MPRHVLLAMFGLCTAGCTLYVFSQLSGNSGTSSSNQLGGCFNLANNQCGQCIARQCEVPDASPPVSLAQVCSLDPTGNLTFELPNCVSQPDMTNYQCQSAFLEGGAYSPTIDTQGAAENNLRKCIFDKCLTSCSECLVPVPNCTTGNVPLADASACGACMANAMNPPSSPCQGFVLQGGCYEDPSSPMSKCAVTSAQCGNPDCTGLSSPDPNLIDASYNLFTCLWGACSTVCP